MTARFAPVPIEAARYMLQHTTHAQKPPRAVMLMEMGAVVVEGDLKNWSVRDWRRRWHCGASTVYAVARQLLEHFEHSGGTGAEHYRNTLRQSFKTLGRDAGTPKERTRNDAGTPRASSLKKKDRDLRSAAPEEPEQQPPDPRAARTHQALTGASAEVWAVWDEQHRAVTGQPARSNQFVGQDAADLVAELEAEGLGPPDLARGMAAFLRASQAGEAWAVRRGGERCCFGHYRAKRPQAELRVAPALPEPDGPPAEVVELDQPPPRSGPPPGSASLDQEQLEELGRLVGPEVVEVWVRPLVLGADGQVYGPSGYYEQHLQGQHPEAWARLEAWAQALGAA